MYRIYSSIALVSDTALKIDKNVTIFQPRPHQGKGHPLTSSVNHIGTPPQFSAAKTYQTQP